MRQNLERVLSAESVVYKEDAQALVAMTSVYGENFLFKW